MKTLYLVRHAKSSWDDPELSDFDRPLNDRGEKDAPRMGKRLKSRGVVPDGIYSSPALRAITTARIIGEILGIPEKKINAPRSLYHAEELVWLETLRSVHDDYQSVMLFGHNPGLTDFVNELLEEEVDNVPTAGVVGAQLSITHWKEAKWGCGKLLFFDFPKNKG